MRREGDIKANGQNIKGKQKPHLTLKLQDNISIHTINKCVNIIVRKIK